MTQNIPGFPSQLTVFLVFLGLFLLIGSYNTFGFGELVPTAFVLSSTGKDALLKPKITTWTIRLAL